MTLSLTLQASRAVERHTPVPGCRPRLLGGRVTGGRLSIPLLPTLNAICGCEMPSDASRSTSTQRLRTCPASLWPSCSFSSYSHVFTGMCSQRKRPPAGPGSESKHQEKQREGKTCRSKRPRGESGNLRTWRRWSRLSWTRRARLTKPRNYPMQADSSPETTVSDWGSLIDTAADGRLSCASAQAGMASW